MLNPDNHPYPWLRHARQITRTNPRLKSDWICCLTIASDKLATARNRHELGMMLNQISYRWLAEWGYHELKTID